MIYFYYFITFRAGFIYYAMYLKLDFYYVLFKVWLLALIGMMLNVKCKFYTDCGASEDGVVKTGIIKFEFLLHFTLPTTDSIFISYKIG